MDDPTTNHYEQQLYSMFKSFDVNNEESLDESAVNKLCDALQLEERGTALADTLFEQRVGRVSFAQFRSGLLTVLGEPRPPDAPPPDPPAEDHLEPRFVFGTKKYGRRSRPQQAAAVGGEEPRAASASRLEAEPNGSAARARYRRSASAVERREDEPALEHDHVIGREDALALCRSLRMNSIDRRLVERIFDDSPNPETTVGEFFDRLNSSLGSAMEEGGEGGEQEGEAEAALAAERVAEAWEGVGVRRPRRLLADLGFVGAAVRPADIERALDEELRSFDEAPEGRSALLAAALVLVRMRAAEAARRRDAATAERDKLRADLADANERARLLAREVDESHSRIENELKASLKRAEMRLTEEARRAAAHAAAERERASDERARLEAEAARARDSETRLRSEAEALRARHDQLEVRALAAEDRCAGSEREGARVAARLREAEAAAAATVAGAGEAARVAAARVEELARENQLLRDRADELAAALEERASLVAQVTAVPLGGALAHELGSLLAQDGIEDTVSEGREDRGESRAKPAEGEGDGDGGLREENIKLTELVKELECSLEAMRGEYDACEEYWGGKLAEERAAHEGEAHAAADRLADLLARIQDFERRLAPAPPALPTIPEQAQLEHQVHELEAEFTRYRREAAARLRALTERLARAERRRAAPAPAPPAPPAELAARCARAETTVRRLHARLAAADLLVKELYVENCHLAHARPLPL